MPPQLEPQCEVGGSLALPSRIMVAVPPPPPPPPVMKLTPSDGPPFVNTGGVPSTKICRCTGSLATPSQICTMSMTGSQSSSVSGMAQLPLVSTVVVNVRLLLASVGRVGSL